MSNYNSLKLLLMLSLCYSPFIKASNLNSNRSQQFLQSIKLPKGFKINYFASAIADPRSMVVSKNATVFVSTRSAGKVYALIDQDRDGQADKIIVLLENLNMPNGIALYQGDLYVAEVNRIVRIKDIENKLQLHKKYDVVYDKLPSERHHGWRYISFGPDNKLYISIGAPCNICNKRNYAQIKRLNLSNQSLETVAYGVRNSVGFDWHPLSRKLWFSDNGRDMMGDDIPPDEINRVDKVGEHFGYPYCHADDIPDPKYGKGKNCANFKPAKIKLQAHVAPLGIRFYTGKQFPKQYHNQLFIAEHGSWNRSRKVGYRIRLAKINAGEVTELTTFAEGWLDAETTLGRPVDIANMPDGSLLISDDYRGVIYRISYSKQ